MIRKMLALLLCLLFALIPAAQADGGSTTYPLPDAGLTITIPGQFNIVLTRDLAEDAPAFAAIGLSKAEVDAIMLQNNFYLDAMVFTDAGVTDELTVTSVPFTQLDSLASLSDEELEQFYSGLKISYDAQGVNITNHEITRVNGHPYILLWEDVNGMTGIQCITLKNSLTISVTLTNYDGVTNLMDKLTVMSILQSIEYAE